MKAKGIKKVGFILKPNDGKTKAHYVSDNASAVILETIMPAQCYRMWYATTVEFHGLKGKMPKYTRNKVKGFVMKHCNFGTTNHNLCPIPKGLVDAGLAAITIKQCHGDD